MYRLVLPACLLLAACGTPQENCARNVQRDLRTIEGLIEDTETNLQRGFAYEYETRDVNIGFRYCSGYSNLGFCLDNPGSSTVRRAVAIDPLEEQRKLDGLLVQKQRLETAQCRADGARIIG